MIVARQNPREDIAEVVQDYMGWHGLTRTELAEKAGVSIPTVRNIVLELHDIQLEKLVSVLDVLGLQIEIGRKNR